LNLFIKFDENIKLAKHLRSIKKIMLNHRLISV
jgi:hypothetical protein